MKFKVFIPCIVLSLFTCCVSSQVKRSSNSNDNITILDTVSLSNPLKIFIKKGVSAKAIVVDSTEFNLSHFEPNRMLKDGEIYLYSSLFYSYFDINDFDRYYKYECDSLLEELSITKKMDVYAFKEKMRFILAEVKMSYYNQVESHIGFIPFKISDEKKLKLLFPLCM